jgi:hypothetical protein
METGSTGYIRRRKTNKKHNTICFGHHYTQANTYNVNKTWPLLQTTGGKDEPNIELSLIIVLYTLKPVLRGQFWDKEKVGL